MAGCAGESLELGAGSAVAQEQAVMIGVRGAAISIAHIAVRVRVRPTRMGFDVRYNRGGIDE